MKKTGMKRKAQNSDDESASENDFENLFENSEEESINDIGDSEEDLIGVDKNLSAKKSKKGKKNSTEEINGQSPIKKKLKNKVDNQATSNDVTKLEVKKPDENEKKLKAKRSKVKVNDETSIYIKCRQFAKLDSNEFRKFFTDKGFEVKAVYKNPPSCPFGFVDFGSLESVKLAIKQFDSTKIKGDIVIANNVKPKDITLKEIKKQESNLEPMTLVDRIMYIRNIPINMNKKNIQDIFPKAQKVIIPSSKGHALRDVIVIFMNNAHLEKAFNSTNGCEFNGYKLSLERITTVPYLHHKSNNNDLNNKEVKKTNKSNEKKLKKLNNINQIK